MITVGLLLFGGYYGFLLWNVILNSDILWIFWVMVALALGWVLLIRTSNKRDEQSARREAEEAVDQTLRARLAADGFLIAVLLARAGSEQMLKEKELPQQVIVVTRSVQIEKLRAHGQWEPLPQTVRSLLLLPDGHWTGEQVASMRKCFETLRCIRWALCLDGKLEPFANLPRMDYKPAHETVENPKKILEGKCLLAVWDIRVERNAAENFFGRCFAEAIGRGLIKPEKAEPTDWANEVNENMRQPHVRDLLAGVQTISELDDPTLRYLVSLSYHRRQCLQLLMDLQDGLDKWAEWQDACFPNAAFVAPPSAI